MLLAFFFALVGAVVVGPPPSDAATGEVPAPSGNSVEVYRLDGVVGALRTGLAAADVAVLGSTFNAASPAFVCGSTSTGGARQNIGLQPRFSTTGQTCKVRLCHYSSASSTASPYQVSGEVTFTAGSMRDVDGKYYARDPYVFDSAGALLVRWNLTTAPASGTVDLWAGSR